MDAEQMEKRASSRVEDDRIVIAAPSHELRSVGAEGDRVDVAAVLPKDVRAGWAGEDDRRPTARAVIRPSGLVATSVGGAGPSSPRAGARTGVDVPDTSGAVRRGSHQAAAVG